MKQNPGTSPVYSYAEPIPSLSVVPPMRGLDGLCPCDVSLEALNDLLHAAEMLQLRCGSDCEVTPGDAPIVSNGAEDGDLALTRWRARCLLRPSGVPHCASPPLSRGKIKRAYLWSYCTTGYDSQRLVVFDFADSRAGRHPMEFLGHPGESAWRGTLVCDDYAGYKALFAQGITETGCLAHARRKFHDLWANHRSTLAEQALALFARLYEVEREGADLPADERLRIRQLKARLQADALHTWLTAQRQKVPPGSATAKAIDHSLGHWPALVRYIDDGDLPADNSWVENQIWPIAIGRNNWLFAGSLRAGKRAAIMSLVHSAKLNGHSRTRI